MESSVPEGYEIEVLPTDSWKDITSMALNFYRKGEPLCDYIGMTIEDCEDLMNGLIKEWVESGFSVAIKMKDSKEYVGFLLGKIIRKEDPLTWALSQPKTERAKRYVKIAYLIETGIDVFEALGVSVGVEHALLSVHESHRGKGLGLAMARKLEELGGNAGYEASIVSATNIATYKIYSKIGFKTYFELNYEDLEFDGIKIYDPSLSNGTKSTIVLAKKKF